MTALTVPEARALQAVDVADAVAMLVELTRVPSVSGSDAEVEIQHRLAKKLSDLDLDVDLWRFDLPSLQRQPDFPGAERPRTEAWGLVGTLHGDTAEPSLVLQGHVDVVPPGDLSKWSTPPFEPFVAGGELHARGACDMKAGVVANLAACAAIKKAGVVLRDSFALHYAVGEEDGGLGAFGTLRRGHTGRACIITEPSSGTVMPANAGALTFTIEVPGLATHGSTSYAGSSAIDSYLAIHQALRHLQDVRNREVEPLFAEYPVAYTISVGSLRAGDWASSVPDLLMAEGRMGTRAAESPDAARTELEEAVAAAATQDPFLKDHPPRVRWSGGQFAGSSLPVGHPLHGVVADAHADVTGSSRPRDRGAPYGSDARLYAGKDIPTLLYGPGDTRLAHGPNESVPIAEMLTVTRVLVLSILRSCGTLDTVG